VQYGAELIERNIGSPMVNTVSSVGRRTGMEQNIRRYLGEQGRRPSDLEAGDDSSRKRQRRLSPGHDAMEIDDIHSASRTRTTSQSSYADSLPAYDDQRSPNYEEAIISPPQSVNGKETARPQQRDRRVNWSTQLIMTTSGLGVALSDTSLRSLKVCLGMLRRSTQHIDEVMRALKFLLQDYEAALQTRHSDIEARPDDKLALNGNLVQLGLVDPDQETRVRRIADEIKKLTAEIWTTLQKVVQFVSRHTGGALPQNASQVVRTQLLSVPQRWQLAGRQVGGNETQGEAVRGANRMLAFAKEGLDMIGQITAVVDGTVQSAESWLARIGRSTPQSGEGRAIGQGEWEQGSVGFSGDEKR
jgi:hypothetical protein